MTEKVFLQRKILELQLDIEEIETRLLYLQRTLNEIEGSKRFRNNAVGKLVTVRLFELFNDTQAELSKVVKNLDCEIIAEVDSLGYRFNGGFDLLTDEVAESKGVV